MELGDPTDPEYRLMRVPVAVELVTGMRPCPAKCWRWYMKGVKGVALQTWVVGGGRFTCLAAVREFIERRTTPEPNVRRPQRRKLSKHTRDFLKRELGI